MDYVIGKLFPDEDFAVVLARTRRALAAQGFGIPTELDTQAVFKAKLGRDSEPRIILGACLPAVAWEALLQEPEVAALLPCNVVVHQRQHGVSVEAVDPEALFTLTRAVDRRHAAEVKEKLLAALAEI
jgi:uncharacterized protein (DUF302 family)